MSKDAPKKFSPLIFIVLIVLIAYLAINVTQTMYQSFANRGRLQELEQQVSDLRDRDKQLQQEVEFKQSEEFIESEARNKLNLSKANETIVIFPETAGERTSQTQEQVTTASSQNWVPASIIAWRRIFWP